MPYFRQTTRAGRTIDVHHSFTRREKKPKRTGNSKATPEQIEKVNERNATVSLARTMNANFKDGDFHVIHTYRKFERPTPAEAKNNIKVFIRKIRKEFKKHSVELKYICVTEYENKAIHHHLIINNPEDINTINIIRQLWPYGKINFTPLYSNGQYRELAEYLIKETSKTFRKNDGGQKQRYSSSRNLIRPKTKVKVMKGNCWQPEPKAPKGYYIDSDTLYNGINPFTGRPFQRYTLIELPTTKGGRKNE